MKASFLPILALGLFLLTGLTRTLADDLPAEAQIAALKIRVQLLEKQKELLQKRLETEQALNRQMLGNALQWEAYAKELKKQIPPASTLSATTPQISQTYRYTPPDLTTTTPQIIQPTSILPERLRLSRNPVTGTLTGRTPGGERIRIDER